MAVNIMIYESRAVITHRGLFNYDPVRRFAGTKRRVLLRHTALRIHRGIADFKQASILRIRILIGVDGWFGIGPWGKEFISAHRTPPCLRKDGFVQWQWPYAIYPAEPLSAEEL